MGAEGGGGAKEKEKEREREGWKEGGWKGTRTRKLYFTRIVV